MPHSSKSGVGHHGGHGTTAAAMVHCVLSIYMSFVRELYINKIHFPAKYDFLLLASNISRYIAWWSLLLVCLTAACKALSLANAKGKGTNGLVIRSLDD